MWLIQRAQTNENIKKNPFKLVPYNLTLIKT